MVPRCVVRSAVARLAVILFLAGGSGAATSAQERATEREEIARLLGVAGKTVAWATELGGKAGFDGDQPGKRLVGLDLAHSRLTDGDLLAAHDRLIKLPGLTSLNLAATAITDAGLAHLRGMADLADLNLAETRITDAGLAHLQGMARLRRVHLATTPVTIGGVRQLIRASPQLHVSRRPRSQRYFPEDFAADLDHFRADWCAENLFAMGEPSLWALARADRQAVAYRFLWEPNFRHPIAIRITAVGDRATLEAVRLDETSGYLGARPEWRRTIKLNPDQWSGLCRLIADAGFWSLPAEFPGGGMADGVGYLIEAVENGKYHVVEATSSPAALADHRFPRFRSIYEAMVKLSRLAIKEF